MKNIITVLLATLVCLLFVALADAGEDNSWMITGKHINTAPSYVDVQAAIIENLPDKDDFYNKILRLAQQYTSAEYNITPQACLQWKLNEVHAEYRLTDKGKLFGKADIDLSGYEIKAGYQIKF